jgi:prephenate dehydratase
MSTTPRPRHAYLGPEGTFAETALRSVAGHEEADLVPMDTVADALAAVRDG